jgi:hypothetical protein
MMERRFDMSDFEQSLKDHADQFNLVPSKRVWKGLYNSLHPGSKWPSVTVAIVFIITLVTIGNLNNSSTTEQRSTLANTNQANTVYENINLVDSTEESTATIGNLIAQEKGFNFLPHAQAFKNLIQQNKSVQQNKLVQENKPGNQIATAQDKSTIVKYTTFDKKVISSKAVSTAPTDGKILLARGNPLMENYSLFNDKIDAAYLAINKNHQKYVHEYSLLTNKYSGASDMVNSAIPKRIFSFAHFVTNGLSLVDHNTLFADANVLKEQGENSSLKRNDKNIKNVKWMYYLVPSISSASFRNKGMQAIPPNFSLLQNRSFNGMTYKAGLGLEAGAQMSYRLSKKWDFITGGNIHYSGYNVVSNLVHPTFTTLSFRDNKGLDYSKTYITHYGNGMTQNQIDLSNYSLQDSVPVGLQYHIWQDENVQVNLLSTIDVSAVLKSNAYIISSDGRYYVKDPSLSRPVNMGFNFNPNLVFSGKKVKWYLGPNIRYQLLSRYKSNYMTKEHLIDYGIRIGISK